MKNIRRKQPVSRILCPGAVTRRRGHDHSSGMYVAAHLLQPTRKLGRAALKHFPIWSCTGRGLPSFSGHPENWCALTAPFHPYPAVSRETTWRSTLCCTFLHVAATPRYGASCPVVFGLSSRSFKIQRSYSLLPPYIFYETPFYSNAFYSDALK